MIDKRRTTPGSERNAEADVVIEKLSGEGQGIARVDGYVWFVVGALPGERVRARVIKPGKSFAIARVMEMSEPSPDRVEPPCPYYRKCGGCVAQHMNYPATLTWKREVVIDAFERVGRIDSPKVTPLTLGAANHWRYRNKGAFPVAGTSASPAIGCYAPGSHDVVDAPQGCMLQRQETNALIEAVRGWMTSFSVPPYDETNHTGFVRHIVSRVNRDGESMLTIVANTGDTVLPSLEQLVSRLREAAPKLKGLSISPNNVRANVIFGKTCATLWGSDTLTERLELDKGTLLFHVSPRSFFQVNTAQAERLVQTVVDYAVPVSGRSAADIYCGGGTIALALAQAGFRVIGVELEQDSYSDAMRNKRINSLPGAEFVCGDAAHCLPELVGDGVHFDVITLDPPRKGCHPDVLAAATQARPERLIYVSCDPATLARDASLLALMDYRLIEATPIDQFCWTASIETVALFMPDDSDR